MSEEIYPSNDDIIKDTYQKGQRDEQRRIIDLLGGYYYKTIKALDRAVSNGSEAEYRTATVVKDILSKIHKEIKGEEDVKDGKNGSNNGWEI